MSYFENTVSYNQILFRYAEGKSIRKGREIHPYNELLFYYDGGGEFLSEKYRENAAPETLFVIPKEQYHMFSIANQDRYKRLVISFYDMSPFCENDIKLIRDTNSDIRRIAARMKDVLECKGENAGLFLYGLFLQLLCELCEIKKEPPAARKENQFVSRCLLYIDNNYRKEISAEKMARCLTVSVSALFHEFKKELGVSPHKYITEKRLVYAHSLIAAGEKPTKIYTECGYSDYSVFYKAYLKMFGCPPSAADVT